MPDQQFASAIETIIGGTADRVLVAAGAGQPVGQFTAAQLRTFTSTLTDAEVAALITSAVGNYLPLSGGTLTGDLRVTNGVIGRYRGPTNSGLFFYDTSFYLTDESGKTRLMSDVSSVKLASDEKFGFSSGVNADTSIDTPAVRDSPGCFAFRNATTAQKIKITKTWTSSTICEDLEIGFTGTNYDFVSRVGSAGGSNQPVRVGHVNSAGTFTGLTVATTGAVTLNTGYMLLGNSMQVFTFSGGTWSSVATNGGGLSIYSASTGSGICCAVTGAAANGTSGDHTVLNVPKAFTPTSGSMAYTGVKLNPTVNQTGGASGVSRGLWINPSITAAADWRAIEVTTGKTILAASTTTTATLNIPSGTAPTSPVNGDIWSDGSDLKVRLGGVTYTLTKV